MNLAFIFIKIYQHTLFTNLSYRNQRLTEKKKTLKLEKNKQLIALLTTKKQILDSCLTDTSMKVLSPLQVRTIEEEDNDKA